MESRRRKEIEDIVRKNGVKELQDNVFQVLEVDEQYTFSIIGTPRIYKGTRWVPIEDDNGHIININKVIYGRKIRFPSNRIEDRLDSVIKAIEKGGLTLTVTKIEERIVRDCNGEALYDELGNTMLTKVYTFNNEIIE